MQRCSQALLAGLLLCLAGLRGDNLLPTAGANTSTATNLTLNIPINNSIVASNTSSAKDAPVNATTETVSTSGAAVTPPPPNTTVTVLPTTQHENSSSTFITPNIANSTGTNIGVSSTAGPKDTSMVFTSQMPQSPKTINSTGSPTLNSTAVTTKPENTTATHIQNSQSPTSPEPFPPKTGVTQMTGGTAAATTPNSVNNTITVSHPTPAVSPTVSSAMPGNVVSTVPQGSTVTVEPKNTLQNTVPAAVKEAPTALSSGSVAAITVTVIFFVLVIFGGAAYLKIRHSSYGRLVDDQDYGSWGNYNNPLYDDS